MNRGKNRQYFYFILFILVSLAFISRLAYLQILNPEFKDIAQSLATRKVVQFPARGLIHDRNGKLLVFNDVVYDLMVIPAQVKDMDTVLFCKLLGIDATGFAFRMDKALRNGKLRPYVFEKQILPKTYASFQEKLHRFPGFYTEIRTDRKYTVSSAAHVLGSIGEVTDDRIKSSNGYYRQGEYVGVSGIERSYEELLRGKKGVRHMVVDVVGREMGSFKDGKYDSLPVSGINIAVTIDADLQRYGEELLQNKIGSVVAIEPQTGEILALVSSPGYDPNLFIGRERGENYLKLLKDPLKPLYNRPLSAAYPPGSTFKVVQAAVAEQEGVLGPQTMYPCGGGYRLGSHTVRCSHRHYSPIDLRGAIEQSCNPYFCYVYRSVLDQRKYKNVKESYDKWYQYMNSFGIGTRLGIDLFGEGKGILYTSSYFDKIYRNQWKSSNLISISIGQGEIGVTPLQMANVAAIMSNGGWFITPHILRNYGPEKKVPDQLKRKRFTMVSPQYFPIIQTGMRDVVRQGTARVARIDSIDVSGKTGTAQNPHGDHHSLFMGFAQHNGKSIAIAVVVENGGYGGTWAAPVASLMMELYLKGHIAPSRIPTEERIKNANLLSKADAGYKKQ